MSDKKLQKSDLVSVFLRSNLFQGSWNFERMQALGWCYSFLPVLKRLYPENNQARKDALKRHLEFFNTQPFVAAPILGVAAVMEEEKANGAEIEEGAINSLKVGMMGPLAGVGDPIFWGTVRPIFAALGASIAINGSIFGPILFLVCFNIVRLLTRYYGVIVGYTQGLNLVSNLSGNILQKVTEGASILGLFVIGVLVNKWANVNVSLVVSNFKDQHGVQHIQTVQDVANSLIPGLFPLLLTFLCMFLLRRGWNAIALIFLGFALGIFGYWIGLLS